MAAEDIAEKHAEGGKVPPVPASGTAGEQAGKPGKAGAASPPVMLGTDLKIYPHKRLPQYDCGQVKAYEVRGSGTKEGAHFALVCERHLSPRVNAVYAYRAVMHPSLAMLTASGVVDWSPEGRQRYVLVYRDNLGRRLLKPDQKQAMGWKQEHVMEHVILPFVSLLQEFRDKDLVHGYINPLNIFDGGSAIREKNILGDCLSAPPSYNQSALYEPVERAMAHPVARGKGTHTDDLYSFGVTLAVMMRTTDPLQGLDDEKIIKQKIEQGSYAAVTGKDRFKGSVLELLRGLLHDEPAQRWTIEEVISWLDGRRLSPKQARHIKKAARPLIFNGKKYLKPPILAMDLQKNIPEAVQLVEEEELQTWLERSLEDEEILEAVENGIEAARQIGRGPSYPYRLICEVSQALDPFSPIRYQHLCCNGDGVGSALAEAFILKKELKPFAEMFSQNVMLSWLASHKNANLDIGSLFSRFDSCRAYIRQDRMGYGIERCLYLLAPDCPCLSDKLKDYYVTSPEEMMTAFEDLCQKGKAPALFLDRHTVAFLSAREGKVVDPFLFDLNADEPYKKLRANLKCLASIQKRSRLPAFPGIAQAFDEMLPMVYERYHDRRTREVLRKSVSRYAASGDLSKMAAILDNTEVSSKDFQAFRKAMDEYIRLNNEYKNLEFRLSDRANFGRATGREIAAIASGIIASVVILFAAFMFFTDQPLF